MSGNAAAIVEPYRPPTDAAPDSLMRGDLSQRGRFHGIPMEENIHNNRDAPWQRRFVRHVDRTRIGNERCE